MISRDPTILVEGSASYGRVKDYAGLVEYLDVVLPGFECLKFLFFRSAPPIDLVTAQDPFETGLLAWVIARARGARLELQVHTDFYSKYYRRESLKNCIRFWIARFLIPRADCVRVVSARLQKKIGGSFLLPIWIDLENLRDARKEVNLHQKYPQFEFIIFMASRLTREKNIGLALEAVGELAKKNPKIGLVIAGDGPERVHLESEAAKLGFAKNVIFEDWVTDLASYYKTADLFLLTSNYEGYGRTLVEAAALDCPIVTTDVGVAGDLISGQNSIIVPVENKQALVKAILDVIEKRFSALGAAPINLGTKEEYLLKYGNLWQSCRGLPYDRG